MIGRTVAQYRIVERLGGGSMGVIYRARDTRLKRAVALKFLPHEVSDDPSAKERFLREAQAASRLDHPNICTVHEIGETDDGLLYIVMALYRGETLKQRIARGPLPVSAALDIGWQIASGLAKAHSEDVVHRDVKPANVLLIDDRHGGSDGAPSAGGDGAPSHAVRVKLLDFGLAKVAGEAALTRTGSSIGTPLYMSPEQIGGASDERTDVWSLGVLLYEMLTGSRPFGGGNSATAMYSILHRDPAPLALARPGLPDDLQPILDRALAKDVDQRYPSVSALADDLAAVASAEMSATQPMLEVAAPPPSIEPERRPRRRIALAAGLALSVAALALASLARFPARPKPAASAALSQDSPRAVAVLPFTFRGRAEFAYLREGMVDLLATKLDGAGDLRSVDPRALLSYLQASEGSGAAPLARASLDPATAARVGRRFGADLVLLGNAVEIAGQLHLDARLYLAATATEVASAAAEGAAAEIFSLIDRLAAQLLAARQTGPGGRVSRLAAVTTESFPALKDYLEGESAYRDGRAADAASAFRSAVAEDPGFALAWYRLSIVSEWLVDAAGAASAAKKAAENAGRLAEHDRRLVEAHAAYSCGDGALAERLYRDILRRHPDDLEAWSGLAETEFHYGPLQGRSRRRSRLSWQRVVELEPEDLNAHLHLARLELYDRDFSGLAARAERLESLLSGTAGVDEVRFYLANLPRGDAAREALRAGARVASLSLDWMPAAFFSGSSWHDPELWLPVLDAWLEVDRSERERAYAHKLRGVARLALGRLEAADRDLRRASAPPEVAEEYRALAATVPVLPVPRERLEALATTVAGWPRTAEEDRPLSPTEPHTAMPGHLRAYVLGLLEARLSRPERTLELAAELVELGEIPHAPGLHLDLAAGLRAEAARLAGDSAGVLERLAERHGRYNYQLAVFSPLFSQVRERWLRAEALYDLGRLEEADAWYESVAELNLFDLAYLAPARKRRAEIAERLGLAGQAAGHRRRVAELWRGADEDLQVGP